MIQVTEKTLDSILKRKFSTLVGTLCERIETLAKEDLDKTVFVRLIKNDLKKDAWNSMREIKAQIQRFSDGVVFDVKLIRPDSSEKE